MGNTYTPEDYLETAKAVMRFVDTRKKKGPEGIYWDLADGAEGRPIYYDEVCMYAGASGIICYLLALYDTTSEEAYLEEAEEAVKYLQWRWENEQALKRNFSQYAFSSGWGGVAYAVTQVYLVTKKDSYKNLASSIVEKMIQDAEPSPDGEGYSWSDYPGIVGNAGTILVLLNVANVYQNETWKQFAIKAGRIFLNKGRDMGEGKKVYLGVNPAYFGGGADYIDPNFPMGTAGIGFTLLRLYEESGDPVFKEAVEGVTEYMESVAVKIGNSKYSILLPHALPDRPNLFYLGYCHGPVGTCRYFYKLLQMTGDQENVEWIKRLTSGLEATGAPEVRTEGYWNTYNLCCGTAGILNLYLGLWAADQKVNGGNAEHYLEMARRAGAVILNGAVREENGDGEGGKTAKWAYALDRVSPDQISTPIGFFDGAAGVGAVLLQLYRAEKGEFHTTRFVDDPFPGSC